MYGPYPGLARQAIEPIITKCDKQQYQLFVACNACCDETLEYVNSIDQIDRKFRSDLNINKCPMQRQMFDQVDTEFIWWFDDDSFIVDDDALSRRLAIADAAPLSTVLWGPIFYWNDQQGFNFGVDVVTWGRAQAWYSQEPIPCDVSGK